MRSNITNMYSNISSFSSYLEICNVKSNSKVQKPYTISANYNSMTPKSYQGLNHQTMRSNITNKYSNISSFSSNLEICNVKSNSKVQKPYTISANYNSITTKSYQGLNHQTRRSNITHKYSIFSSFSSNLEICNVKSNSKVQKPYTISANYNSITTKLYQGLNHQTRRSNITNKYSIISSFSSNLEICNVKSNSKVQKPYTISANYNSITTKSYQGLNHQTMRSNITNKYSNISSFSSNLEICNVKSNSKVQKPYTISANYNSITTKSYQGLNHQTMRSNITNKYSNISSFSSNLEICNVKSNSKVQKPYTISANYNSITTKSYQGLNHPTMRSNITNKYSNISSFSSNLEICNVKSNSKVQKPYTISANYNSIITKSYQGLNHPTMQSYFTYRYSNISSFSLILRFVM
ncbi:unnamed protein product [Brachionus calyciflorus]|uniref:Uncharacterized protein n=1 Tax=Brachionus calyciflorus TaxID=104777 RepID=A0A814B9K3_9BILA|nr:unnamed protein product [Brachionus calyciflorus]